MAIQKQGNNKREKEIRDKRQEDCSKAPQVEPLETAEELLARIQEEIG